MSIKQKTSELKALAAGLFIIYLIILIWAVVFKFEFFIAPYIRSVNLIPYNASAIANGHINISEIALNIIAFIPFGIFISILKPHSKFIWKLMPVIITTVLIEFFQYLFCIGALDITDIINNVIGGIAGILFYHAFFIKFGNKINKVLTIILFIGIIILCALIMTVKLYNTYSQTIL